jgi:hypothetical protein
MALEQRPALPAQAAQEGCGAAAGPEALEQRALELLVLRQLGRGRAAAGAASFGHSPA